MRINYSYHNQILLGISDVAQIAGFDVINFVGGPINRPDGFSPSDLYDLIDPSMFDGLIVTASSVSRYLNDEAFIAFLSRFSSLPCVNISRAIPGFTNICPDNKLAMFQMLEHLVFTHGKQRIALIVGPTTHAASQVRIEMYREFLTIHKIAYDEQLIFRTNMIRADGRIIAEQILGLECTPDAVFAINDQVALGIIESLKELGLKVPEQIAVCGFTDDDEGECAVPSLTTINENAYLQGKTATQVLIDMIDGKLGVQTQTVPVQLIIRNSCGCLDGLGRYSAPAQLDCLDVMRNAARRELVFSSQSIPEQGFQELLEATSVQQFTQKLKANLARSNHDADILLWCAAIRALKQHALESSNISQPAKNYWHELDALVEELDSRSRTFQKIHVRNMANVFQSTGALLTIRYDLPVLGETICRAFGIRAFFVALYDHETPSTHASLIAAFLDMEDHMSNYAGKRFESATILPGNLLNQLTGTTLIVQALFFRNDHLGYLVSSLGIRETSFYEALQSQLSGGIKSNLQLQEITSFAYFDTLTGLYNRMLFVDLLNRAIKDHELEGHPSLSVLFLDLDRFKWVNDSLGHSAGDALLKLVAERLRLLVAPGDILGRFGGDEFVIFTFSRDPEQFAERINSGFKEEFRHDDRVFHVSASIGIACFPEHGTDAQALLKNADKAMYQSKNFGKNRCTMFSRVIELENDEYLFIENAMIEGLVQGHFKLVYQARYECETSRLLGFEALLRLHNPQQGLIAPDAFIHIAEETGIIDQLGEWVFTEACRQLALWQTQGHSQLMVSVNVSGRQFQSKDIVGRFGMIMRDSKVRPGSIELEITENAIIQNELLAHEILLDFRRMGISIALDDFGTGYSSLSLLKKLPVDTVKIDRSFVMDSLSDRDSRAIVESTIAVCQALSLRTVAEGVETREQWEFLKASACNEVQGYYFSKPLSASDASALLVSSTGK